MSIVAMEGGQVPNAASAQQFHGPYSYGASISLRVVNTTSAVISYTLIAVFSGENAYRCANTNIPAGGYMDIEKGLKIPEGTLLSHTASGAGLYWSTSGFLDDGS